MNCVSSLEKSNIVTIVYTGLVQKYLLDFVSSLLLQSTTPYRSLRKSPSPEAPATVATVTAPTYINLAAPAVNPTPAAMEDPPSDPELAKYLNRDYWEQRKTLESPASPSAPSPMSQTSSILPTKVCLRLYCSAFIE